MLRDFRAKKQAGFLIVIERLQDLFKKKGYFVVGIINSYSLFAWRIISAGYPRFCGSNKGCF